MTVLANLLERRSVEDPGKPLTDASLISLLGGVPTHSGVSVNSKSAVRFIAVYRAVSLVAGVIAALPLQAKDGYEVVEVELLKNPHPDMPPMELWERVLWQQLLGGNSYSSKIRDRSKAIIGLDPYDMGTVTPRRVKKTARNPWGKEFDIRTAEWPKVLTPEDVLHIPGPGYDGVEGLSPIGVARQGIGVGLAAEEFGARHFGSGSLIGGVLQTDQPLDQPQADATKARWKERIAGLAHAHDVAVLDRGLKFQPIAIPPRDAQFLETRKFAVTDIARLYGVPPHLLADTEKSTSWGTGIEQQNIGLILFTLSAWMTRLEQRIAKECVARSLTVDFDTADFLRGDLKAQVEAAGIAVEKGIWVANEARKAQRLPPIDGGDLRTIPSNWSILGDDGLPLHVGGAPNDEPPSDEPPDEPPPDDEPYDLPPDDLPLDEDPE